MRIKWGLAARISILLLALAFVASCSSSDGVPVPKGFEVPAGVTLTPGGTNLTEGHSASVVFNVASKAASAITVTVTSVRKGKIADFRFFSLDVAAKESSPFYVTVKVKNEGPAGLGGAALPMFAHDSDNTIFPPNELVGTFEPCPNPVLPKTFLKGATAQVCMVFLVPKGRALQSVDLQTSLAKDAITWSP